jgi:rSAM/selenodomain-associated transferase 2
MANPQAVQWPSLAVVIPVLNDALSLEATLKSLAAQSVPASRVLVVDGGSRDDTVAVARAFNAGVRIVPNRGRGGQIAAGVAALDEEGIVIGHADMIFPPASLESIGRTFAENSVCPGGCLGHRFDSPKWIYRLIEWLDRRRARRGESYGDQAQFFRRAWLARVGGFPDQPIMEDMELSRRLRALGQPVYLDAPVTVSPRRFERLGWWRTAWANWNFRRAYRRHGFAACQEIYEGYYPTSAATENDVPVGRPTVLPFSRS